MQRLQDAVCHGLITYADDKRLEGIPDIRKSFKHHFEQTWVKDISVTILPDHMLAAHLISYRMPNRTSRSNASNGHHL